MPITPGPMTWRCAVMPKPLEMLSELDVGTRFTFPDELIVVVVTTSLDPVEFSGLSTSIIGGASVVAATLLCRRWRFDDVADRGKGAAPGPGTLLGGAAAIGTTPFIPAAEAAALKFAGVLPPLLPPDPGPGLSPSWLLLADRPGSGGVVALALLTADETAMDELLRDVVPEPAFFLDLLLLPPTGRLDPDPRFLFFMTSVFRLKGRTTPWSFKNKPHALHSGWPSGLRRHKGVV